MKPRRVATRAIIYKDGKIFAQRLKGKDGENDYWSTPGGGLDDHEPLLEGLHRELIEETGVAPQIGPLVFVQQFDHKGAEQLEFFFVVENVDDYETIDLDSTTHGAIEVAEFGFIDPKTANLLPVDLRSLDFEELTGQPQAAIIASHL